MRTPDPNRLLLVAYDFPPIDSAGMQRIVSMAKYLTRAGWRVTVLTVRSSFVPRQSQASLDLIPEGVEVVRTRCFELRRTVGMIRRWAFGPDADAFSDGGGSASKMRALVARPLVTLLGRIDRAIGFPDSKIGWFWSLLLHAWRATRRRGNTVVLSSSPPHSLHLPLLLLRSFVKFRWVVDFRDPWTVPVEKRRNTRRFRRERKLETRVLKKADVIIANTPGNKAALLETFAFLGDEKIVVVTNGFDTERVAACTSPEIDVSADLVYTGYLYPGMLDTYLDGIRHLLEQGKRPPRLRVFGPRPARLDLEDALVEFVSVHDSVPYEECLDIMRRARALLVLVPYDRATCVPSKLYPYLFSATPILSLGPEGDAADIIAETGTGCAIASREPAEVATAMETFFHELDGADSKVDSEGRTVERYGWNRLGARLADALQIKLAGC